MKRTLSSKAEQYIKDNYLQYSDIELGKKFGVPKGTICSARRRFGLQVPKEITIKRRSLKATGRTTAHPFEDEFIRELYLYVELKTIGEILGRGWTFVNKRLQMMELQVPPELVAQRKAASKYQKGQTPANKGKKQTEFMSAEGIERTKATRFHKNQKVWNEGKDGDIRIRHNHQDRNERPYKYIRIKKGCWRMLNVYNWEQANGPVPEGYIVVFKDGDTMNCEVDNLELITRAENMKRNTIHNYPVEVKQVIRLSKKLTRVINEQSRKADTEVS